MTKYDELIKT